MCIYSAVRTAYACCTLLHQGAMGLRGRQGGCKRDWVGTPFCSRPTPKPQPVTQSL